MFEWAKSLDSSLITILKFAIFYWDQNIALKIRINILCFINQPGSSLYNLILRNCIENIFMCRVKTLLFQFEIIIFISTWLCKFGIWKLLHKYLTRSHYRRRQWHPTPVFLPGESWGPGSLVGCRLWGRTESDMTEAT